MGSFVRISADPNDIFEKHRFRLYKVTGLEMVGGSDTGINLLQVSNYFQAIPINKLSDDNFSEEEVVDVQERIKDGLLNRLTVVRTILHKCCR